MRQHHSGKNRLVHLPIDQIAGGVSQPKILHLFVHPTTACSTTFALPLGQQIDAHTDLNEQSGWITMLHMNLPVSGLRQQPDSRSLHRCEPPGVGRKHSKPINGGE
ncbi:MAG: hypothetical protein D6692_00350 [Planctomycetota bacterium]|nr:MAG: hypothetical protein D6692_00350 [Planctomycetota bacterium]